MAKSNGKRVETLKGDAFEGNAARNLEAGINQVIEATAQETEEQVEEVEAAEDWQKEKGAKEPDILASAETPKLAGQLDEVGDNLDEVFANSAFKRTVVKAVDIADESWAMEKLRVLWSGDIIPDSLPEDIKHIWKDLVKAYKYMVVVAPETAGPQGQILNTMVKLGLLPYEEETIQDAGEFKRLVLKYGLTIAAIFDPALLPLLILIKPINRILASQDKFLADVREYRRRKSTLKVVKGGKGQPQPAPTAQDAPAGDEEEYYSED